MVEAGKAAVWLERMVDLVSACRAVSRHVPHVHRDVHLLHLLHLQEATYPPPHRHQHRFICLPPHHFPRPHCEGKSCKSISPSRLHRHLVHLQILVKSCQDYFSNLEATSPRCRKPQLCQGASPPWKSGHCESFSFVVLIDLILMQEGSGDAFEVMVVFEPPWKTLPHPHRQLRSHEPVILVSNKNTKREKLVVKMKLDQNKNSNTRKSMEISSSNIIKSSRLFDAPQ